MAGVEQQIVVYRYGCPSWADLDDVAMGQLRLAHDLRNRFVEIEREHAAGVAAAWREHPNVAVEAGRVEEAQELVAHLVARSKKDRQADRSTVSRHSTATELAAARAAARAAKAALKAAKSEALPAVRSVMSAARDDRHAALKATYSEYVQERGLYWATYNAVRARHDTAVKRVNEQRKQGRPAELRFHRWTGEGTITVQVQRQADDPVPSPELFASGGGRWRDVAQIAPWIDPDTWAALGCGQRRRAGRGRLRMRVRGVRHGSAHLDLPVVVHRPMPAGAEIKQIQVTRRRVGTRQRVTVAVTCRVPAPVRVEAGATVAVRLGWASAGDGWLRIARVATSGRLDSVPADVAGLVRVAAGGASAELHYSAEWRRLLERDDDIRSIRDRMLDELRADVVDVLNTDGHLAGRLEVTAGEVARWRAPARFARLAAAVKAMPAPGPETGDYDPGTWLAGRLGAWRQRDRHLWDFEANERDQVVARRRHSYRVMADWLCRGARQIVLHGLDLSEAKRSPEVGEDPEQARRGRAQMQIAAPGELRAAIEVAARRRGIDVIYATETQAKEVAV